MIGARLNMNFKLFNVETTNMFPMSNSTKGGQLLTEYNLIGKESALTTPSIEYTAGMSFVHSESEFLVTVLSSGLNYLNQGISNTDSALMISKGRAVVNGYYVESLIDIVIDLANINSTAETPLTGNLAIGLKTYFSNGGLIDGAIQVEENIDPSDPASGMVFGGLQVVIVPAEDVRTPRTIIGDDNYGSEALKSQCNMDLLLATFNYTNGNISNIIPNPTRLQCIPGSRIEDIDGTLNTTYISKAGLQQYKFYTFAGKGDPTADTWCDSTDALMVWDDAAPRIISGEYDHTDRAKFLQSDYTAYLHIPHKQIDGMTDGYGNPAYYESVNLNLPVANFSLGTPGVVNSAYTQHVKNVLTKLNEIFLMPAGIQKAFISELTDREKLPPIYQTGSAWAPGDYVLVAKDQTLMSDLNDALNLSPPSTMYVVLPPLVLTLGSPIDPDTQQAITRPNGVELDIAYVDQHTSDIGSANPLDRDNWWDYTKYRGRKVTQGNNGDYFTLSYTSYDENNSPTTTEYFYPVATTDNIKVYSDPIQLTGQYPFATTTMTGGFLDVDTANIDNGYVYLDENGHLRLLDYGLLRTGVLAYQLGEDFTMPSGLTYDEMQANLDEYVNERVAFPNATQTSNAETNNLDPYVININLNLPASDEPVTLKIANIDSRFNTAICINLIGEANANTVILVENCQKVRIASSYGSMGPSITVRNSCLYYDVTILNNLYNTKGLTLWYKRYTINDPQLTVDGMTVRTTVETTNALSVENIDYWTSESPNDNHIQIITKSITFAENGEICGCGVLIRNNTTANVNMGKNMILDTFTLPNISSILPYPENCLSQPIYVTGEFVVAYPPTGATGYVCIDTQFTLRTQSRNQQGQLAVMLDAYNMASANPVQIDSWSPNTYHVFNGVANNL